MLEQQLKEMKQLSAEQMALAQDAAARLTEAEENVAELEQRCKQEVERARQSFAEQIDVIQAECNSKIAAKEGELAQVRRMSKAAADSRALSAARDTPREKVYASHEKQVSWPCMIDCWASCLPTIFGARDVLYLTLF